MDNYPTALFDSYELDFKQIISSIREKLDGEVKGERGGEQLGFMWRVKCCRLMDGL